MTHRTRKINAAAPSPVGLHPPPQQAMEGIVLPCHSGTWGLTLTQSDIIWAREKQEMKSCVTGTDCIGQMSI